jgi:hypothetical protein
MYYLIQKFQHELYIEDVLEGDTLEKAIENAFNDEKREGMICGNDVIDTEMSLQELTEWIKEDNYEVTCIFESESPIKTKLFLG